MTIEQRFQLNLLRLIAASAYFDNCLNAAREMFGKGYFSLGPLEKAALEQAVIAQVDSNYQAITPEFLEAQQARHAMGFPIQNPQPMPGSSTSSP